MLLRFDPREHFPLGLAQSVQLLRALDELGVLVRTRRGATGCEPIAEGFAHSLVVSLRYLELELSLLQRLLCILASALRVLDGLTKFRRGNRVHEVVQCLALLHFGQVAHDGAAQTDQETGEHKRHQPQAATKPLFRQT